MRFPLSPLVFVVDHRNPGAAGGPTLRVRDEATDRELLRFDCFAEAGHWHVDPTGRDEISRFAPGVDGLEWTLEALRQDLAGLVERAGVSLGHPDPDARAGVLDDVERALRHPPVDFDAIRPESRRPSHGEKWTQYPEDVLPVWVADMDFPIAEPIRRMLARAVERSDLGYPVHPAPTDVPQITAARMQARFGWEIDPKQIEILTDVVQGMYVALSQFSEPGEGAVVQTPIYPPFLSSVRKMKRELVTNPLAWTDAGYRVDLDGLRAAVQPGTRLLLLCNPHNPSGRVFTREELEGIADVACERDLVVVSDEIHGDLVYPGATHIPIASLSPEIAARTVTLTAASKAFNLAGLRTAVAIFGSTELRRRFNGLPSHLRGGIGTLGIEALRVAWTHGQPWLDQTLDYLDANRRFVADFVASELPGVVHHSPEATYLAWLDCRALGLEPSPYQHFLEHGRVALSEGLNFGPEGRGFARINFATSRPILSEALERVAKSLR